MVDLYKQVRLMDTLAGAWKVVRSSSLRSSSSDIRNEAQRFDDSAYKKLKSIQTHLQKKTFQFEDQLGVAKPRPGKDPRPLVIAPIPNRIVQRAILDVLQKHVSYIEQVLVVPTSFGGIRGKNVEIAVEALNTAFATGTTHYIRSDIPSFFTKVVRRRVVETISSHVGDSDLVALFSSAIETTLVNLSDLEKRNLNSFFPLHQEGVAQGSPLSPLIANIYLSDFDRRMNEDGIVCIRYIDDFVILANSEKEVSSGFRRARAILKEQGLQAYSPEQDSGKASRGKVRDGFEFLGCYIKPGLVQPSKAARRGLLEKIDNEISRACSTAKLAAKGAGALEKGCYGQALSNINNIVWGWGKAFHFCTGVDVIKNLDGQISQRIIEFDKVLEKIMSSMDVESRRKVYGVRLLLDAIF